MPKNPNPQPPIHGLAVFLALVILGPAFLTVPIDAAAGETVKNGVGIHERYTAQRRPRVTVLEFNNTNQAAQSARYGASVEAMLVTFLKRKSQLLVVEREQADEVIKAEWNRIQTGEARSLPQEGGNLVLEKIDAFVLGSVTLLDAPVEPPSNSDEPSPKSSRLPLGRRIEIDAKILSRHDGRIIAAVQRRGPVSCLRSIVERLGIALEQEFLRPYYGSLEVRLSFPENVRIHLTPILMDDALDEEKPPFERSATVRIGGRADTIEPWTTDPTSSTVDNILTGWYLLRLERPGYEVPSSHYRRWQTRESFGRLKVYDLVSDQPLENVDPHLARFVVHVDPLAQSKIDADALGFTAGAEGGFVKKTGSIDPRIKRQYLDTSYGKSQDMRVYLIGDDKLDINSFESPDEFADDPTCDLFDERLPSLAERGETRIGPERDFDIATYQGGKLIIEDYSGEDLPTGTYEMYIWEPHYRFHQMSVSVHEGLEKKPVHANLTRSTSKLLLRNTGKAPRHAVHLVGQETGHRAKMSLHFTMARTWDNLPVDRYVAQTDIEGLLGWREEINLIPGEVAPPVYAPPNPSEEEGRADAGEMAEDALPPFLIETSRALATPPALEVKTKLHIGGRLGVLGAPLDPDSVYVDDLVPWLLDSLRISEDEDERFGKLEKRRKRLLKKQRQLSSRDRDTKKEPTRERSKADDEKARERLLTSALKFVRRHPELLRNYVALAETLADIDLDAFDTASESLMLRPRSPEELLKSLVAFLEEHPGVFHKYFEDLIGNLDLLILDDEDLERIRERPAVADLITRYLHSGGAIFAFALEEGWYENLFGESLKISGKAKKTRLFSLAPGEVAIDLDHFAEKKKIRVKSKRPQPHFEKKALGTDWRVVAYTKHRSQPRIVELGDDLLGGYALLWADEPEAFRNRRGGGSSAVARVRASVESRVLDWARFLMYRRYDSQGEKRRQAELAIWPNRAPEACRTPPATRTSAHP